MIDFLDALSWDAVVEPRGASFESLRNLLLHGVEAEDYWVNFVIPGRADLFLDWDHPRRHAEPYGWVDSMEALRGAVEDAEARSLAYLADLTPHELARTVARRHANGDVTAHVVEDVLVDVVTHDFHHRGEMLALLWQRDVQPPSVDWIDHV